MTSITNNYRPHMGGKVNADQLEELGKIAARLFSSSNLSLNDSVVEAVGHVKLNAEQVRRVVEFANVTAFNTKFSSLQGPMRAVGIDGGPADPVQVLQMLNKCAHPQGEVLENMDYSMSPSVETAKISSVQAPFRTRSGTISEIMGLHQKLSAAHADITASMDAASYAMNEALLGSVEQAKRASREGATPADIFLAWHGVSPSLAKVAFSRTGMDMRDGTKVASTRSLNPEHGVVQAFSAFVKAASAYSNHVSACQNVEQQLRQVGEWLSGVQQ